MPRTASPFNRGPDRYCALSDDRIRDSFKPLDSDDTRPQQEQIAEQMRAAIAGGVYRQGERLPDSPQIARCMGLGWRSVRAAFQILHSEGAVRIVPERGVFVRGITKEES